MDVSCPRCDAVYEFDLNRLRGGAVTLKCSQCDHLFRLEGPGALLDESQRRWMVRQHESGDILYFVGFDTLHRWMMEGKITAMDAISRSGNSWRIIGEIGEFSPIFQVLSSIKSLRQTPEKPEAESKARRQPLSGQEPTAPGRPSSLTHTDEHSGSVRAPIPRAQANVSGRPAQMNTGSLPRTRGLQQLRDSEIRRDSDVLNKGHLEREAVSEVAATNKIETRDYEGWSLGELELPPEEFARYGRKKETRGHLLLGIIFLTALGGFAYWQRASLTTWAVESDDLSTEFQDVAKAEVVDEGTSWEEADRIIGVAYQQAVEQRLRMAVETDQTVAMQEVAEAREAAREVVSAASKPSIEELLRGAKRALDRGDGRTALRRYEAVMEEQPRNPEALVGLGWAYLAMGEKDTAVARFESVIRGHPGGAGEALIGLGRAERERQNPSAALRAYEEYLARYPRGVHISIAEFQSRRLREQLNQ